MKPNISADITDAPGAHQTLSPDLEAAVALSNAAAHDQEERLRDETIMADLAGSPMSSICAEYESKFYDNLGISYLKLLMFSAVTCLAVIVLHVPNPFFYIVSGIMTLYIGALFIRRFWPGKRQH